ncbi:MAG: copper resistance CopC family protein [Hyphomonadaceae bacterium]
MRNILLALAVSVAALTPASLALAQSHDHGGHSTASEVQTTPADGAMGGAPEAFTATFPHAMRLTNLVITAQGGDPLAVSVPNAAASTTVAVPLPRLAAGNYTIAWTASGADNHTMTGRVRYMVH